MDIMKSPTCAPQKSGGLAIKAGIRFWLTWSVLLGGLPLFAACTRGCPSERPPIHLNPNMDRQFKYLPQSASSFFYNGSTMQAPVEGTVARGELRLDKGYFEGLAPGGEFVQEIPAESSPAMLERGRDRYRIYCLPCHGERGDGNSMLLERAQIQSADLLQDRIQQMPAGQLFDVISNGLGLMPGYAYPLSPRDRWAITAFVQSLVEEPVNSEQAQ